MHNFPKWLYHKDHEGLIVRSQEELDKLGFGWVESPSLVDVPYTVVEPVVEPVPEPVVEPVVVETVVDYQLPLPETLIFEPLLETAVQEVVKEVVEPVKVETVVGKTPDSKWNAIKKRLKIKGKK